MPKTLSNKKSIVFLPGWGFKPSIWTSVADHLTDFAPHLLDLPKLLDGSMTSTLIKSCPDNAALVGWSLGGLIATLLYLDYPEHFTHLILISSTPKFTQADDWIGISEAQAKKQLSAAEKNILNYQQQFLSLACHPNQSPELTHELAMHIQQTDSAQLIPYLRFLFDTDTRAAFTTISIPVLQIISDRDRIVTKEQSMQSERLLQHQINIIPEAGHMLLKTHPSNIAQSIREFIC
jgi:pimeloyl-[acyl-carrier protein] methyl ester esterase